MGRDNGVVDGTELADGLFGRSRIGCVMKMFLIGLVDGGDAILGRSMEGEEVRAVVDNSYCCCSSLDNKSKIHKSRSLPLKTRNCFSLFNFYSYVMQN